MKKLFLITVLIVSSISYSQVGLKGFILGEKLDLSLEEFYSFLVEKVATKTVDLKTLNLERIVEYSNKFYTVEWNYGKSPKHSMTIKKKYDAGNFTISLELKNNIVKDIKINGDYFSLKKIQDFENAFIGVKYNYDSFLEVAKKVKVKEYFYKLKFGFLLCLSSHYCY